MLNKNRKYELKEIPEQAEDATYAINDNYDFLPNPEIPAKKVCLSNDDEYMEHRFQGRNQDEEGYKKQNSMNTR